MKERTRRSKEEKVVAIKKIEYLDQLSMSETIAAECQGAHGQIH